MFADSTILRANLNIAQAALHLNRPGTALFYALSALRRDSLRDCQGDPKALYRAGMACHGLHMPQAAAFFLSQVRHSS